MVSSALKQADKPGNGGAMHGRVYVGTTFARRELRAGSESADMVWEDLPSASKLVDAFMAHVGAVEAEGKASKVWLEVWGGKSGAKRLSDPCVLELEAEPVPEGSADRTKDEIIRALREQLASERAAVDELGKRYLKLSEHIATVQVDFHKQHGFERDAAIFLQGQKSIEDQLRPPALSDKLEDLGVKFLDRIADRLVGRLDQALGDATATPGAAPASSSSSSSAPSEVVDEPADLLTFRRILDRLEVGGYSQTVQAQMAHSLNEMLKRTYKA